MPLPSSDRASQPTPGPWRVRSGKWVVAKRGEHEGEILIAPTYWMENVPEEAAANARLIAAAPDLLEALKDVLRIAKAASIGVTGNAKRIERADAAIARATGASNG